MKKIHEFNPVIYPRKLWVIHTEDKALIENNFFKRDGTRIIIKDDVCNPEVASVFPCIYKETGGNGYAAWFRNDKCFDVSVIAHESVHVATGIFNDCGIMIGFDRGEDEHFAYLVGWIADCINQVKTGKIK